MSKSRAQRLTQKKKTFKYSELRRRNNNKQTNKYTKSKESHRFYGWKTCSSQMWILAPPREYYKNRVEMFGIAQFVIAVAMRIAARAIKSFDVQFTWERLQWQWTPSLISFSIKIKLKLTWMGHDVAGQGLASPETWNSAHRTRARLEFRWDFCFHFEFPPFLRLSFSLIWFFPPSRQRRRRAFVSKHCVSGDVEHDACI